MELYILEALQTAMDVMLGVSVVYCNFYWTVVSDGWTCLCFKEFIMSYSSKSFACINHTTVL